MSNEKEPIRELFIEELAEVQGGGPDWKETVRWLADQLQTTFGMCEEGGPC